MTVQLSLRQLEPSAWPGPVDNALGQRPPELIVHAPKALLPKGSEAHYILSPS